MPQLCVHDIVPLPLRVILVVIDIMEVIILPVPVIPVIITDVVVMLPVPISVVEVIMVLLPVPDIDVIEAICEDESVPAAGVVVIALLAAAPA